MKFIPLEKAKIEFNEEVLLRRTDGSFTIGKLVEKKATIGGIEHTFEVPRYHETPQGDMDDFRINDVTHIAYPRLTESKPKESNSK